jgi:cobalt-zinc-cadmium efflux system protein
MASDSSGQTRTPSSDHAAQAPGHVHAPANFGMAFAIGIGLNTTFVVVEFVYGLIGNSMALIADAGHNLSDVLGLVIAWVATVLARQAPSKHYTYGLRGSSILAALFNAMFLLTTIGAIAWEAILRFGHPEPTAGRTVMIIAAVGIVINGVTALMFASGRKEDINIRGAFLHMAADAAVSVGVLLAGAIILLTGWHWIDPAASLAICAIIFWSTWGLLKDSVRMSLSAVPPGINPAKVRAYLQGLPGVAHLHDLHIWPMSTTETALTCHLVIPEGHPGDAFLMDIAHELQYRFGIGHATVQTETSKASACALAPDEVL